MVSEDPPCMLEDPHCGSARTSKGVTSEQHRPAGVQRRGALQRRRRVGVHVGGGRHDALMHLRSPAHPRRSLGRCHVTEQHRPAGVQHRGMLRHISHWITAVSEVYGTSGAGHKARARAGTWPSQPSSVTSSALAEMSEKMSPTSSEPLQHSPAAGPRWLRWLRVATAAPR